MAAGVIIGRVSVKVIPDTSDFKESLRRDLERIERSLDPIEIEIEVDTEGVAREAGRARDRAQEQMKDLRLKVNLDNEESIRRSLGQLNRELERLGEIDLDVDLNEADLNAALDLLNEQLEGVRRIKIQVDEADPADVARAVGAINRELEKIKRVELDISYDEASLTRVRDRLRDQMNDTYRQIRDDVQRRLRDIQIGIDVDPAKAARALRKIEVLLEQIEDAKMTITPEMDDRARVATERKIQDLRDQVSDIEASIHPDLDTPASLDVRARLALLARSRFVQFIPTISGLAARRVGSTLARLSGARILSGYMRDLYTSILEFDKSIPRIIGLSLAVAGLGAAGLASASNIFALSASLASIAPVALAIPGILGGIAVGVGVTVAALKDFNKIFPDVQATLSKMQHSISDNFWAGAKASMREMIDVLLPALGRGFDRVAINTGNFFSKLASAATKQLTPALGPMFDALARSIDIAAEAADNIVGIITTLGTVGSAYLPRLATFFAKVTTQFDNFLKRSTETGEIFEWIDTGIAAFNDLVRVGKNAALILYDISKAATAAGGTQLNTLADALERIRVATSSAGFQRGLTEVFASAHEAINRIVTISGPALKTFFSKFGETIAVILPIAGEAIGTLVRDIATALSNPVVAQSLITMFDGIGKAVKALTPIFGPLGVAIATLGPLVGALAQSLANVLAAAIPPLVTALVEIGEAVTPLIPILGDALLRVVQALAPHIGTLATAFADFVSGGAIPAIVTIIEALIPVIEELAPLLSTALVDALVAITPYIPQLATSFADLVIAVAPLIPDLLELIIALIPLIPLLLDLALVIVNELIPSVKDGIKDIGQFIDKVKEFVGVVEGWVVEFKEDVAELKAEWKALTESVDKAWEDMKKYVRDGWKAVKDEFSASWDNLKQQVKDGWQAVKDEFSASWDNLKQKVKDGWRAIKDEFSTSWANLKQQVKDGWNEIKADFTNKMTEIRNDVQSKWAEIKTAISTKLSEIKADISAKWSEIKSTISTKISEIRADVNAKWNEIKTAIATKMSEIKSDVASKFSEIKSSVSAAGGEIVSTVRTKFGEMVTAVREKVGEVVSAVRELPGKVSGALGDLSGLLSRAGRSVIDGFISGLRSGFDRVRTELGNLTAMIPEWKGPAERDASILTNAGKLVIGGFIDGLESQYAAVKRSLGGLTDSLASSFGQPITADLRANLPKTDVRKGLIGSVKTAVTDQQSVANGKTLIYNAAPGSSLGSEEDLFAAADRGRMVGW